MTPSEILAAIVTVSAIVGGGAKWIFVVIRADQTAMALKEAEARIELSQRLHDEIRLLRVDLSVMHKEKKLYLRRIYQLEAFIHSKPGMDLPIMEGWPPV